MKLNFILIFTFLLSSSNAIAQSDEDFWSGQGEIAFEFRQFKNDSDTNTIDEGRALFARVETKYENESGAKHVLRGYGRVDRKDDSRSIVAFEDAYFSWLLDEEETWKVLFGYKLFNWSTTEAFHPADTVNSRNFDSNLENLEKKGELTVQLQKVYEDTELNFYFWPKFEKPESPGKSSRMFLSDTRVDIDRPLVASGGNEAEGDYTIPQYGFMLNTLIFDADLSFHIMQHVDRQYPIVGTHKFTFNSTTGLFAPTDTPNKPYYFKATQVGMTIQRPIGPIIFKLEAAHRKYTENLQVVSFDHFTNVFGLNLPKYILKAPADHTETAVGLEYIWSHEASGMETNFFLEAISLFGPLKQKRWQMSAFQRDIMLGLRHAFNDDMGREIFFSFFHDIERPETEHLFNMSYTQRISDNWKVNGGVRYYDAPKTDGLGLQVFDQDHNVFLNFTRFF